MQNPFARTELLLGTQGVQRLAEARVALFGLGGVGGYVAEALARSGIGALDLIDDDCVAPSNLNRQLLATRQTIGLAKVDVAEERIHSINPDCTVRKHKTFYLPETAAQFDFTQYDYVVDAIDTVTGKLLLIEEAFRAGVPVISCMGTGNKLHPELLELADISQTSVCPLARIMRKELGRRGIRHLKVVYSKEKALTPREPLSPSSFTDPTLPEVPDPLRPGKPKRSTPGSTSFVPGVAGLILAGEVVRTLSGYTAD